MNGSRIRTAEAVQTRDVPRSADDPPIVVQGCAFNGGALQAPAREGAGAEE